MVLSAIDIYIISGSTLVGFTACFLLICGLSKLVRWCVNRRDARMMQARQEPTQYIGDDELL
jgi:hypothetical protein